jgi:hypothetical protein
MFFLSLNSPPSCVFKCVSVIFNWWRGSAVLYTFCLPYFQFDIFWAFFLHMIKSSSSFLSIRYCLLTEHWADINAFFLRKW